jgi:hypothetical protein
MKKVTFILILNANLGSSPFLIINYNGLGNEVLGKFFKFK